MLETMKALTVYQPWASLLACGAKRFETRSWATRYRGPIAIHAGMKKPDVCVSYCMNMDRALGFQGSRDWAKLPLGAIIATAELVGCRGIHQNPHVRIRYVLDDTDYAIEIKNEELWFGDWTPGRYAWELANVRMLPEPIPCKGQQGLWTWQVPEGVAV